MRRILVLALLLSGCVIAPAAEKPAGSSTIATAPAAQAPVQPAVQSPVKFESDGSKKGAQGPFRLEAGKRTFKAEHKADGNFIVWLKPAAPSALGGGLAFNETKAGKFEWAHVVSEPGDYFLDVQAASGAWSISVE